MMTVKEFMKIGALTVRQRKIEKEMKELQAKRCATGYSFGFSEGHCILYIGLAEYLRLFPDTKPTWTDFSTDAGETRGWHQFGPTNIGKLADGTMIWIESRTETVVVPQKETSLAGEQMAA